jgi:hypothetical protein
LFGFESNHWKRREWRSNRRVSSCVPNDTPPTLSRMISPEPSDMATEAGLNHCFRAMGGVRRRSMRSTTSA